MTLSTSSGTTTLPRGVGVLPMVYVEPPPARRRGFDLVFHGSRGDQVLWAVGIAPAAAPLPISGMHYGLAIDPAVLLVLPGATILDPSGQWRLPFPATDTPVSVYLQALFVSSDPAYAPGAFSNLLRLTQ